MTTTKWWSFTALAKTQHGWTEEHDILVDVTKIRAVAVFQDHTLLYVANLKAPIHVAGDVHRVIRRLERLEDCTVRLRPLEAAP